MDVDDADDPRLVSAFGSRAAQIAAEHGLKAREAVTGYNALRGMTENELAANEAANTGADATSAAAHIEVSGREILDDVTLPSARATVSASSERTAPANPHC